MAFLRKRGKYFSIIDYDTHRKKQISFPLKESNKKIAEELLKEFNAKKQLRLLPVNLTYRKEHLLLLDLPNKYFTSRMEERRILSGKTKTAYLTAVKSFSNVCGNNLVYNYSKTDFNKYLRALETSAQDYSQNTIANYIRHLYILFNWLKVNGYIHQNIFVKLPGKINEPEPIPADHLKNIFLDLLNRKLFKQYLLVKLTYLCALRKSEAILLHGADFDKQNKTIYIRNTKGKRIDAIPMLTDIEKFVSDYDFPDGRLFNYNHVDSINSFWSTTNNNLSYSYTFHQLRKTRGSDLADAGIDPLFLKKFMRHKDFRTTQKHYIKLNRDKMRDSMNEKLNLVCHNSATTSEQHSTL